MHILVAPDSYKGSLSATNVANAIAKGIQKVFPEAHVSKVPIADGGEGTVEALVTATNGQFVYNEVAGPFSETVKARWGILGDGKTAVIEMAEASGLMLIPREKRNPCFTTTYGTGQLIKAALDKGLRKFIIGIGGSGTNDGGAGLAQALGVKLLDAHDKELSRGGAALGKLAGINIENLDKRLQQSEIIVACDVDNPLCGANGAAVVFGPQKGATTAMVAQLDLALDNYQKIASKVTGKNVACVSGAGAAGGMGAGLMFFTKAKLQPGVEIVLNASGLEEKMKTADIVITGEGCTDFQTVFGKAPVGIAKLAKKFAVPVVCLSGSLGCGYQNVLAYGIDAVMDITPGPMKIAECMQKAESLTEAAATRLGLFLRVGINLKM